MDDNEFYERFYANKFYDSASGRSFWRGYWYYKDGNVKSFKQISDYEYEGVIKSDNQKDEYNVTINLKKPRASKCNCPFADGKHKVCKHMVALYFAVFPDEVKQFDEEVYEFEKEQERKAKEREEKYNELKKDVSSWSRERLENYVINTMLEDYDDEEFDDENEYLSEYYW